MRQPTKVKLIVQREVLSGSICQHLGSIEFAKKSLIPLPKNTQQLVMLQKGRKEDQERDTSSHRESSTWNISTNAHLHSTLTGVPLVPTYDLSLSR